MFDLQKHYAYDKGLAESGAKMVCGPNEDEDFVGIRKLPNREYSESLAVAYEKNNAVMKVLEEQGDSESRKREEEITEGIMAEAVAETLITGWGKGVVDGDGKPIKFSVKAATEKITKYPEFGLACVAFAKDKNNYPYVLDVEKVKK